MENQRYIKIKCTKNGREKRARRNRYDKVTNDTVKETDGGETRNREVKIKK